MKSHIHMQTYIISGSERQRYGRGNSDEGLGILGTWVGLVRISEHSLKCILTENCREFQRVLFYKEENPLRITHNVIRITHNKTQKVLKAGLPE